MNDIKFKGGKHYYTVKADKSEEIGKDFALEISSKGVRQVPLEAFTDCLSGLLLVGDEVYTIGGKVREMNTEEKYIEFEDLVLRELPKDENGFYTIWSSTDWPGGDNGK